MWRREVFLSYSWDDSKMAREIYNVFGSHAISCWIDQVDAVTEPFFQTSISSGLIESALLVVLLTPNSIDSEWVRREVQTFARLQEFPPEQQGEQAAQDRKILVYHLVDKKNAQDVLSSWLEYAPISGNIKLVYQSSRQSIDDLLDRAISLLQPRRREVPQCDISDRPNSLNDLWSANPIEHWRSLDPAQILSELEVLNPPYREWLNLYPDPVDRRVIVLLEAVVEGIALMALGDDFEDGTSRTVSRVLGSPVISSIFDGILPQIRYGSPFDMLFQLSKRSNISTGVQDAFYRLRSLDLKWNQRDLLDLTVVWLLGVNHDYWICEDDADIDEILTAIKNQEPF